MRASQRPLLVFAFPFTLYGCTSILGDFSLGSGGDAATSPGAPETDATGDGNTPIDDSNSTTADATSAGDAANQGDAAKPVDAAIEGGEGGGACSPPASRCSGSNGVQSCVAGTWGPVVACMSGTCSMGACSGTCSPGTTQCSGSSLQRCDGTGVWGQPMACGSHQGCTGGGDAGPAACACNVDPTCSMSGAACASGTTIAACAQDAQGCWYPSSTSMCSNGACFGSAGSAQCCTNSCTNGATQCGGAGLQTCVMQGNGCTAWNAGTACGTHQSCTGSAGSAGCTCAADSTCSSAGNVCVDSTTMATCAADSQNCIYTASTSTCGTNKICNNGSCVCANGYTPCGTTCADTQTDNNNCGSCGKVCPLLSSPSSGATCTAGTCIGYVGGYVAASSASVNADPDGMSAFFVKATMPAVAGTFSEIGGVVGSNDPSGMNTEMIYGLYADNGAGAPGNLLFNTSYSDTSMSFADPSALHTLVSGGGLYSNGFNNTLSANTTYWIYMKAGTNSSQNDVTGASSSPCQRTQWINVDPPTSPSIAGSCPGDFQLYMVVTFP
jgi:hypothetical protein